MSFKVLIRSIRGQPPDTVWNIELRKLTIPSLLAAIISDNPWLQGELQLHRRLRPSWSGHSPVVQILANGILSVLYMLAVRPVKIKLFINPLQPLGFHTFSSFVRDT
jgi:hypothetical protein